MKKARLTILLTTLAVFTPWIAAAQDGTGPIYLGVECMKSKDPGYAQLEIDVWQPMHQHLVDHGQRASWALYRVAYGDRSRCDYYAVTTYAGPQQLDVAPDFAGAFEAVHSGADADAMFKKTLATRDMVATELWVQVDSTEIKPHRYAIVNKMLAEDPVAYESMESEVFKAGHETLIADGHRAGWAVYALVSPLGNAIPYNYGTVDFVNELGPVPMAEAMLRGNPDRDLDAMYELLELREQVLSETWELVAATD